ncbi:MAG: hypothetical protein KJ799_09775 [Bacteroidetes bacterium]|nr:hypothetical protein [Bacteroidota bacterium]
MFRKILTYCVFLCASVVHAQSEELSFERLGLEDGLSQSVVTDIAQDSSGFLWFSTQDGLNRYDGYEFKVFKGNPTDSNSIRDNWIAYIVISDDSTMWVGSERDGLFKFSLNNYEFQRVIYDSINTGKKTTYIRNLELDDNHNLYIGTWGEGLFIMNLLSHKVINLQYDPNDSNSLIDNRVRSLYIENKENIWIGTTNGLNHFNPETNIHTHFSHNPANINSLSDNYVISIGSDSLGSLFIGTRLGLNILDKSGTFHRFSQNQNNPRGITGGAILDIFENSDGKVWLATHDAGVILIENNRSNYQDLEITNFYYAKNNLESISANYVRTIFKDKDNILWFGTWGASISKLDLKPPKFHHVKQNSENANSIKGSFTRAFFIDSKNRFWVGFDEGIVNFCDENQEQYINVEFEINSESKEAKCFNEDNDGTIWLGTKSGLWRYNEERNRFEYNNISKQISDAPKFLAIFSIEKFDDFLLLSSSAGLLYYNIKKNLAKRVLSDKPEENKLLNSYSSNTIKGSNGNYWISAHRYFVYKVSFKRNGNSDLVVDSFTSFSPGKDLPEGSYRVNFILESNDGDIWFATSYGLFKLNPVSGKMDKFLENDGLPNNITYSIAEDSDGNIWVATNLGLSKISKKNGELSFRNYDVSDGLQSNEFNQATVLKAPNGVLYFGGINGFNYFDPAEVIDNPNKPQIALTSIKIFNNEVSHVQQKIRDKRFFVNYSDNMFSFDFAALEFTNPKMNEFSYKLDGFDKAWIRSGYSRTATYTNISPGEYILYAKASNNDGVWSYAEEMLRIIVIPPYWMTWWFRSIVIFFLLMSAWYFYHNRVQYLLKMERLRTKISSDLHDEVGSMLTQISINADLLQYVTDPAKVKKTTATIISKSGEVINMMRDVIWSIDSRNDNLGSLVDRIQQFAVTFLNQKNIKLIFENAIEGREKSLKVDFRQNVMLILKEAVNNSVKYSESNKIKIFLSSKNRQFQMEITDFGIGLDLENIKRKSGLKNMVMRAEQIGARISFINKDGFTISLIKEKF